MSAASSVWSFLTAAGRLLRLVSRFVRFAALGATVSIALVGSVTGSGDLGRGTAFGLAAVAVAHHLFSFILNDVIDLPIDRTELRRAGSPLVRGMVSPKVALIVALGSIPVAFLVSARVGAGPFEQALLALSLLLLAVYDLWGKRFPLPPVMDLIQGVGWAFLAWYGAQISGGSTVLTAWLGVFFVVYILMTNGVHGGMRDLANDLAHGARTTPIWLGATPLSGGGARIPQRLARYAIALQLTSSLVVGAIVLALDYTPWTASYAVTAWLLMSAASFHTLRRALDRPHERQTMMVQGTLHLIYSFGVVLAVLAPAMPLFLLVLAVLVYVTPLLTYGWLIDGVRGEPRQTRPA